MPDVTPEALLAEIQTGRQPAIVDVRSAFEFHRGRVPGATHVPFWLALIGAVRVPLNPEEPVVVYCGHGPRAWVAACALRRRGARHVRFLQGHMAGWRWRRLPEETGRQHPAAGADRRG